MSATQPNTLACELAVRTDPGRDPDKQVNEDAAAHVETTLGLLAIVCDGMGGHAGGKEAAELAVKTIIEEVQAAPPGSPPGEVLRRALTEANARVWNMPTAEPGLRPGSTAVVVLVHEGGAEIAHVGDSRVYLVHAGAIAQVTRDHSMVQELVDRNIIKAEDAQKHPDANKILRALGIAKEVEVEVRPEPIAYVAGDVFILCSDGLSDLVTPAEILEVAAAHPPAQAAGRLVDLANARGGHDNITTLVLRTKTSAAAATAQTLVKTMPLTAHAPSAAPPEQGSGPGGTVVAAPIAAPAPPVAAPPPLTHPPEPPSSARGDRGRIGAVIGLAVALVALAVLGLFWINRKDSHKPVPVVHDEPPEAAAPPPEDTEEPPPVVSVAPLATPPGWRNPHWDGGRAADPCVGAARARANGAPDHVVQALEAKCRADGGTPADAP